MPDNNAPDKPAENKPPGQQPEAPPAKAAIETKPITPPVTTHTEPANMEVHKHPHHVTHKKKWSEYLLEFFMLFLAVFLGFLVENYREHRVEKERGKQYLESFYEDLKADTARIMDFIDFDAGKLVALEKLDTCYKIISRNVKETACLLEVIKSSSVNRPFKETERTLNQLFNAGGFRLLPMEDADSIIAYQKEYDNFQDFQETVFQEAQDKVRSTLNTLINFEANVQMFKPKGARLVVALGKLDSNTPILFNTDKALLNQYFNELQLYYRVIYNHRGSLLNLRDIQTRLIQYFESKYHFK